MNEDIKKFLDSVKEADSDTFKVYVPSQKKELDCKPLSFKQQKDVISTVAEGVVGAIRFQKVLNAIILDNLGSVLMSDRNAVIVAMRKNAMGNFQVDDNEIDLDEVLKSYRKVSPKKTEKIKDRISATLEIPTIEKENKILNSIIESFKKNGDDAGKNLSQIYTYEIIKYIKDVELGETKIIFDDLKISEMVQIVESLPLWFNKKVIDYVQDWKISDADALKVGGVDIEIDVSFFDG